MNGRPVATFQRFTKHYEGRAVVEDLSFAAAPGRVVGLIGRNGAGKSTSLRGLLGLVRPTSGDALVFGRPYAELPHAARRVGVSLDGVGHVPGATGRRSLRIQAKACGVPARRVEEVLELVELTDVANRPLVRYSTGMRQRHALATAMLGDPELLVLDEPANGLDPDGIQWLRRFLRRLAREGRTVLLSSHLLAELEQTVDDIVVIQRRLLYAGSLRHFTRDGAVRLEDQFLALLHAGPGSPGRPAAPPRRLVMGPPPRAPDHTAPIRLPRPHRPPPAPQRRPMLDQLRARLSTEAGPLHWQARHISNGFELWAADRALTDEGWHRAAALITQVMARFEFFLPVTVVDRPGNHMISAVRPDGACCWLATAADSTILQFKIGEKVDCHA